DPRDPRSFDRTAIEDPAIRALTARVRLDHEDLATYGSQASGVTLTLKDGRVLGRRLTSFKGTPDMPVTSDDVYEKFTLLTRHCPKAKTDEIFERLQNIE